MRIPCYQPRVGMGVTIYVGSDVYAGTIISVSRSGRSFRYQKDTAQRGADGRYVFQPNPAAPIMRAEVHVGEAFPARETGTGWPIDLDRREHKMDPSF